MRLSRLRPLHAKKRLLVGMIILFVLLLGSYAIWSNQAWAQLTPHYTQWHQGIKADLARVVAMPTVTTKEQDMAATALASISNKIATDQRTICTVTHLAQWQQAIIPAYKQTYTACQKKLATIVDFQKQLAIVIGYNKDDQALSKIIAAGAPPAGELASDVWARQVTAWTNAISATEKMSVTDSFKPTRQLALKQMTAINASWQEVIAAHEAKDKQKYLAAQSALATAIDGLNDVTVASQQAFSKLSGKLESASGKAFTE